MSPDEVPQALIDILDQRAGKQHSRTGPVVACLSEILTRYGEIQAATFVRNEDAEARRRALMEETELYPSFCVAHRRRVLWMPSPTWWYHRSFLNGAPETCRPLWNAHSPAWKPIK
jgi:hypothetical protein